MKFVNFQDALAEELKNDEEFKKEYERLEPIYKIKALLIEARIKKNMTQKQIAEKMGIKQPNLNRFEKNTENAKIGTLIRYAKAVGLKELKIEIS